MTPTEEEIIKVTRQLYPTGRAFRMPVDSYRYKLHKVLAIGEGKAYDDAVSILDSALPDNDKFTVDDAAAWEIRLQLPTNPSVSLDDRKAAILRKMQAPGNNPAKSTAYYLESQLQAAGFNVYVYENMFPTYPTGWTVQNPAIVNPNIFTDFQQGDPQEGQFQQGGYINSVIVNSLLNSSDIGFDIGNKIRKTFFIGGPTLGTYANVPAAREIEFRQLILQIKRVHNIGYLFINYI